MLMPKKHFRFNQPLFIGSAAFVFGFGAVMSLLVSFAPIRVPNASVAFAESVRTTETQKEESSPSAEQESTTTPSKETASPSNWTQPQQAASTSDPVAVPAPEAPVQKPEPTTPEQPVAETEPAKDPIITLPDLPIDDLLDTILFAGFGVWFAL